MDSGGHKFNMLASRGESNCEKYDDTKTTVPTNVGFYNNTIDMHIFTTIHIISKLPASNQNQKFEKAGNSRNFGEKIGKIGQDTQNWKREIAG